MLDCVRDVRRLVCVVLRIPGEAEEEGGGKRALPVPNEEFPELNGQLWRCRGEGFVMSET